MRISEIEIMSLFGYFNHKIPLKNRDRITIIHGPNGVGKTTVLRLVHDLFNARFYSLLATPYDKMVIRFKPKGTLTLQRTTTKNEHSPKLVMIFRSGKEKIEHTINRIPERELRRSFPLSNVERMVDSLERIGPNEWYDDVTDEAISLEEVVFRYGHILPGDFRDFISPIPDKIEELFTNVPLFLVETQRLFTRQRSRSNEYQRRGAESVQRMTVEHYSEDMVNNIQSILRESGSVAASLDRTFPHRLIGAKLPQKATESNIRKLYSNQSLYRDRLMGSGLIEAETQVSLPDEDLDENDRKVLWLYLNDVEKKLRVYDPLLQRLELFKEIVNSRFSFKEFRVDKEMGFVFTSNHDGSRVPPRALSSGEQHEIVLTYQLLFRAKRGSLIFIDEPELSLHVTWQRQFLEDIGKISKLAELDFLVATHSPSIIHNRRDLMVPLAHGDE